MTLPARRDCSLRGVIFKVYTSNRLCHPGIATGFLPSLSNASLTTGCTGIAATSEEPEIS